MLTQFSGTKRTSPDFTTSMAFCAIDWPSAPGRVMATYHWSVSIGSTTAPERAQRGTMRRCFFTSTSRPSASRSATMALRATKRSMPRYFSGALSLMVASSVRMPITSSLWRWPTA
ncbi:hypothetical protein D3C72_1483090 [compost metagenome]